MFYLGSELIQHSVTVNYQNIFSGSSTDLHSLLVQLIGDVLGHVPDVAHAV